MPALIPIAGAVIGAGAAAIGSAAGVGQNKARTANFKDTSGYDESKFQYNGNKHGADNQANYYNSQATAAQGRGGQQADYGNANAGRDMGVGARQQQVNMAQLMANRASGLTPSMAQMQADRQMQQGAASQASMMAGARGAGGMALAGQNAANNTATMQSAISGQAQQNAAMERMQAEQGAMGAYSQMRGGDMAMQQQDAQQSQYNAGLRQQQAGLNDQYSLGMEQNAMSVRAQQLQAGMNQQQMLSGSHNNASTLNAGANQKNADAGQRMFEGGVGAITDAASSYGGGGGKKAEGGPVAAGSPYLVGEKGPELVVPQQNSVVVPAAQTRDVLPLYEPPGKQLHQGFDGRAFYADEPSQDDGRARLESRTSTSPPRAESPKAKSPALAPKAKRKLTPEELLAAADQISALMSSQHKSRMDAGPSAREAPQGLIGGRENPYGEAPARQAPAVMSDRSTYEDIVEPGYVAPPGPSPLPAPRTPVPVEAGYVAPSGPSQLGPPKAPPIQPPLHALMQAEHHRMKTMGALHRAAGSGRRR